MKKERETKEYLEFVEQFQEFLILMTEEWGAKVTLQKAVKQKRRRICWWWS